ncbi:MAG: ATP-dependent RecD-like DNA helicase [Clostridia bacterium]|nr:ATP-dependent RecD-like DNA helicase [Clostridia bacterium]
MEIEGEIEDVIYQNEANSYMIADFGMEEEVITIVGYLPFVNVGDTLRLYGKYVEHKDYGRQFKVDTFEKLMPKTLASLERYLASGSIKGVGEATAKRIVDAFKDDTIHVLKYEPEKLAGVRGISEKKAQEISESFVENFEMWQIVGFLEKFGLGAEHAKKVYKLFGLHAIEEIEANPYLLLDIARGVDFKQIDKMAIDLGFDLENRKRVESGIKFALIKITYNGHCCTLKNNLILYVKNLLNVNEDTIENSIIELKAKNEIVIEKRENEEEWIYLNDFYQTEVSIATRIIELNSAKNYKKIPNIEKELKKAEEKVDIELSERQKEAIRLINENNVTIITGGPGTGKTTIIKTIIDIFEERKNKVVLCAPTGRAAKKMTETTGKDASTLHRLLEIGKVDDDSLMKNYNYEGTPIDADVIIVDELSMVDMFLMNYLLKCIYKGTKVILVGDSDQLPSVGPGSVLKDLIASEKITTVHLDKIFRQAAKSKIILNAHRVNSGESFLSKEEQVGLNEDFFFIDESNQEKMLNQVISLCTGRLKKYGNYDFFKNIQVLTPTKKGLLGTKELNKILQENLNPNDGKLKEKNANGAIYRVGDRVMQIKNNYDMYWEKDIEEKEYGSGVFNGETGTIINVDNTEKQVEVQFDDDKICWYEFNELEQIEHSYSITIHKAQRKRI